MKVFIAFMIAVSTLTGIQATAESLKFVDVLSVQEWTHNLLWSMSSTSEEMADAKKGFQNIDQYLINYRSKLDHSPDPDAALISGGVADTESRVKEILNHWNSPFLNEIAYKELNIRFSKETYLTVRLGTFVKSEAKFIK